MKAPPSTIRAAVPDVSGLRIPEGTLELLRTLIEAHCGIHYDTGRLDILRDRLVPLAIDRGFDTLLDYYYLLKYDADAVREWPRVMDALAVQETYFWREPDQFRALATVIMPALVARGRSPIRIWSVPCATGEEPLSIAMALDQAGWFERVPIEIHASDASEAALTRARQRHYGRRAFRQLPDAMRDRYFTSDAERQSFVVKAELHTRITAWTRVNIMQPGETAVLAGSDIIFCRNLFIYFTPATVREATSRFFARMPSPGYLCVGSAESLLRTGTGFELHDLAGAYVYLKP
jgi:chemotaxis protein methyltransferase CheR